VLEAKVLCSCCGGELLPREVSFSTPGA
jgi:hypothetical protein